jgi:hypothetical protein
LRRSLRQGELSGEQAAGHALNCRSKRTHELAKEIREGGRYAFSDQPKIAAKFVSRHRASANRRSRRKTKAAKATKPPVG